MLHVPIWSHATKIPKCTLICFIVCGDNHIPPWLPLDFNSPPESILHAHSFLGVLVPAAFSRNSQKHLSRDLRLLLINHFFVFANLDQREGDHENVEMVVINAQDPEQGNLYYLFEISTRLQALFWYKIIYEKQIQVTAKQFCNKFRISFQTLKRSREIKPMMKFVYVLVQFLWTIKFMFSRSHEK